MCNFYRSIGDDLILFDDSAMPHTILDFYYDSSFSNP